MNDRDDYDRITESVKKALGRQQESFRTSQKMIVDNLEKIVSANEKVKYLNLELKEAIQLRLQVTTDIDIDNPERNGLIFPDEEALNEIIEFIENQLKENEKIVDLESDKKETPQRKFDIPIKAYSPLELQELYNVKAKTFYSWLKPHKKIGKLQGRKYTPAQVRMIFSILDTPDDKQH